MTALSAPFLTADIDLPAAELQSALLDGDVFRIDRAFCSIAEFDVPWRRAAAIAAAVKPWHIVARWSAAWVWGASAAPPGRHDVIEPADSRHGGARGTSASGPVTVVTAEAPLSDVVDFGPVRVTSPTRTVIDLARLADADALDETGRARLARLAREHRVTRAGCEEVMARSAHLPHVKRARQVLDEVGLVGDSDSDGGGGHGCRGDDGSGHGTTESSGNP